MKTLIFKIAFVAFILSSCNMGKHYANYRTGGKSAKEIETEQKSEVITESGCHFSDFKKLEEQTIADTFLLAEKRTESNEPVFEKRNNRIPESITKKAILFEKNKLSVRHGKKLQPELKSKIGIWVLKSKNPGKQILKKSSNSDFWEIAEGVGSVLLLSGLLIYAVFFAGLGIVDIIALLLTLGLAILIFWGLWKLFSGFLFMFDN